MKMYNTIQRLSLVVFIAFIVGCEQFTGEAVISSPTLSIASSNSVSAKETMTPSLTLPFTYTTTPSPTLTIIPTLSIEDGRKKMLELLETNGDCRLPCLWGITPGKSNYQEARVILIPLSGIAETILFDQSYPGDGIKPQYVEGEFRLNSSISYLYNKDGILSRVHFKVIEEKISKDEYGNAISTPVFDSPIFAKRVQYYSLSHVLFEYGLPDSVLLHASGLSGPVIAGGMEIAFLYPEQGIAVNYSMSMYNQGSLKKGCPNNAHIDMELYPPGNSVSFFSELKQTDWGKLHLGEYSLDEATDMSIEKFYETFRNPTDKCIETPANLWSLPK